MRNRLILGELDWVRKKKCEEILREMREKSATEIWEITLAGPIGKSLEYDPEAGAFVLYTTIYPKPYNGPDDCETITEYLGDEITDDLVALVLQAESVLRLPYRELQEVPWEEL